MSHHLRRILTAAALFVVAGMIYQVWRQKQPGYGLFDLLRAREEGLAVVGAPSISEKDVPSLAKFSEESQKLAAAVLPAVVSINTDKVDSVPVWQVFGGLRFKAYNLQVAVALGSGVIIDKQGYVVTNHHVIEHATRIIITTNDGEKHDAEFIGADEDMDLAVLRIVGGKDFPTLSFANSDEVKVGQLVFAVGNPFGLSGTVTQGIISATQRQFSNNGHYLLQTDTVINPGNSGGPLVNVRGEVVGINRALYSGQEMVHTWAGVGLTIPSNEVKPIVDGIIKSVPPGGIAKGYLGLEFSNTPVKVDPSLVSSGVGAMVESVDAGSPADKAGFRTGDVILKFNGQEFSSPMGLRTLVARAKPGLLATIVVWREGQFHSLVITLGRK
jgi:serine protease Do